MDRDVLAAVAELRARGVLRDDWSDEARRAAAEARRRRVPRRYTADELRSMSRIRAAKTQTRAALHTAGRFPSAKPRPGGGAPARAFPPSTTAVDFDPDARTMKELTQIRASTGDMDLKGHLGDAVSALSKGDHRKAAEHVRKAARKADHAGLHKIADTLKRGG